LRTTLNACASSVSMDYSYQTSVRIVNTGTYMDLQSS